VPDSVANRIADVTFHLVLKGYRVAEVDAFFRDLSARLARGQPIGAKELEATSFRKALKGYNVQEVDTFMADISSQLGR
jgi:DivIVA domain-containing protein